MGSAAARVAELDPVLWFRLHILNIRNTLILPPAVEFGQNVPRHT